jgi:dihydroorotate dehydrogenase electron transfer subunit
MGPAPVAASILAIGELAPGRTTLELRAPTLVAGLRPGHALHLVRAEAGGYRLRRVAPVTKVDPLRGSVEVALQPRADGGRDSLAELRVGDTLTLVGPIGRPITLDAKGSNLLLVSDTEGFAWLRLLAISAVAAGRSVVFVQEAQSAHELAPASLLPEQVELVVATADGSLGHAGVAADLIANYASWADQSFAAGSAALLAGAYDAAQGRRGVDRVVASAGARAKGGANRRSWMQLLLTHEIGCGSGVCGGCTLPARSGDLRLCREGPAIPMSEFRSGGTE